MGKNTAKAIFFSLLILILLYPPLLAQKANQELKNSMNLTCPPLPDRNNHPPDLSFAEPQDLTRFDLIQMLVYDFLDNPQPLSVFPLHDDNVLVHLTALLLSLKDEGVPYYGP